MKRDEENLHILCNDFLNFGVKNAVIFHPANGGLRSLSEAMRFKRMGLRAGVADLVMIYKGRTYFLEIKSPAGRLTPEQLAFADDARSAGAEVAVIRSLDDLRLALKAWGIRTRAVAA